MNVRNYKLDFKGNGQIFTCNDVLYTKTSEFQEIEIADLKTLGKVLVLDNIIQLSALDCDVYHESFAHIPASLVQNPKRALILGGGDGILAKELLKYKKMEIDLIDIDEEVCKASNKYLSELNDGALSNERVKVYNMDALAFCKQSKNGVYDLIFGDITDPHPNSPSESLLSTKALETYKHILKKNGVIAIQTDNVQIAPNHVEHIDKKLQNHFTYMHNFSIVALTLGGLFSFVCATNSKLTPTKTKVKTNWLNKKRININLDLHNYIEIGEKNE